jgi:hypothetical protein
VPNGLFDLCRASDESGPNLILDLASFTEMLVTRACGSVCVGEDFITCLLTLFFLFFVAEQNLQKQESTGP